MKAAVIATLMIPVFCASAAEYSADLKTARTQANTWCAAFEQIKTDLSELGVELPPPSESYEHPEAVAAEGETLVTSELGMLFDNANSRVIYLGNVRLQDPRLNLTARDQLLINLPAMELGNKKKDTPPEADTPAEQPTVAEPVQDEAPADEEAEQPADEPYTGEKASIITESAIADTVNNAILLYAPREGGQIHLTMGKNIVRITNKPNGKAPRILADPQGNIFMEGEDILLCMTDKKGETSELRTESGLLFYHAGTHTVYTPGKSQYTGPQGTLSCTEMLTVLLTPAAQGEDTKPKTGFMSQFTGLKFEGIETATAKGQVIATAKAREGRAATRAEGDELHYNGKTGELSLLGSKCHLTYGDYVINADEGIHLLPNGDIELRGKDINGSYARTSSETGQPLHGTFKANNTIIFRAELGTINTENGITMADEEIDFTSSGPTHLVLARKEGAKKQTPKPGMPNLAIAEYGDVLRARATGNVIAHRYEPGTRKCIGELKAETVVTDLKTGETIITGAVDKPLIALYNGNRVESKPAEGQAATMEILTNGDLKLNGADITATLLTDKGSTTAKCKDYVLLVRAEDQLETGSSTRLYSETGILTTNGPMSAKLLAKDKAPAAPGKKGIAGLRFNYIGIKEATTNSGCTVQTEKGSMQNTGAVRLVMDTEQKSADKMLGGLKYATAYGNVAIAGRDKSGRLLRATGDKLHVDAITGKKVLSGREVTLADINNTHKASGKGAAISIDADNNASITGAEHTTYATNIREQLNEQKKQQNPQE